MTSDEECFPIKDAPTIKLCAGVNYETEKVYAALSSGKGDSEQISCIHYGLCDVKGEDYVKYLETHNTATLPLKSSESTKSKAPLADRYLWLKSWAQGVADQGVEGIMAQANTDVLFGGRGSYGLGNRILRFVVNHVPGFADKYLEYLAQMCMNEKPCLIANLDAVKNGLPAKKILEAFPDVAIAIVPQYVAKHPGSIPRDQYITLIHSPEIPIRKAVAASPLAVTFPEFVTLFSDPDPKVRYAAINNKNAASLPEYSQVALHSQSPIRAKLAKNTNTTKIAAFPSLFGDKTKAVKRALAANPEAPQFPEYVQFFTDRDATVRRSVAGNPNATRWTEEFQALFHDPSYDVQSALVRNPSAALFSEYSIFLPGKDLQSESYLRAAAANPNATRFPEYTRFFEFPIPEVRINAAHNLNAPALPGYDRLIIDVSPMSDWQWPGIFSPAHCRDLITYSPIPTRWCAAMRVIISSRIKLFLNNGNYHGVTTPCVINRASKDSSIF
jgi:hypothetical protein